MTKKTKKSKQPKVESKPLIDWKKTVRWVAATTLFVVVVTGGMLGIEKLKDPTLLPLSVVHIDGDFKYLNRRGLERVVGRVINGNFFTIDLESVRQAALGLPWVEQVTVRRIWPDGIEMVVVEQVPLARWGKSRLISTDGELFKPQAGELPIGLPLLNGPDGQAKLVARNYYSYRVLMEQLGLEITELAADSRLAWSMVFTNGMELKLGKDEPQKRLGKFSMLYRVLQETDARQVRGIDLRYTNGASILWGGDVAPASDSEQKAGKEKLGNQIKQASLTGRGQV